MFTRRWQIGVGAWCVGVCLVASSALAEDDGWSLPKWPSASTKKATVRTLKKVDAGTKKLVRGTIDVITLRPLWDPPLKEPAKPWLNSTSKTTKKKSAWGSWFGSKESNRSPSLREFVGQDRPN
ncbi:MAG: hypothetical protein JW809_13540 [Pirellulales bacterium]|nr:hypothetical protein [Pirellulales bacterium]